MYDLIIKNGTIIDGTGRPMFSGDVGIKNQEIEEVGDLRNERAEKIIDARGKFITPGFIDVNNHSDTYWRIFSDPDLESLIYQGITTIIGGNCGSSLAPLVDQNIINTIQKWTDIRTVNLNWLTVKEFLAEMEKRKLAVNFGTLVGHGTIRRGILKDEVRSLTSQEFRALKHLLRDALRNGALGLSTGLVYTHAKLATPEEIEALAKIIKEYEGVYTTHIRGEAGELIESVTEAIRVAEKTKVKLHIAHLKAIGEKNWHLMDEALNLVEASHMGGLDISFDVYPYTATGSVLYVFLPDWVAEGGKAIMLARLKDPETRAKVIAEMKKNDYDYSKITISISPLNKTLARKKIADIAASQKKSIEEALIDILVASDGRVVTISEMLSERNIVRAIRHPLSMIASDGAGYSVDYKTTGDLVHPRNFGAFPKFLGKYIRGQELLSWEEAISKITGKPALKFNLKKRGIIAKRAYADIVIFDPKLIDDCATVENPYQYSQGIEWMIINGKIVVEEGKYNGEKAGEIIRRFSRFGI